MGGAMRRIVIIAACLLLSCEAAKASGDLDANYRGSDGGVLVYSMGTLDIGMAFAFNYRKVGDHDRKGIMHYSSWEAAFGLVPPRFDFSGRETGIVALQNLEPGRYELYQFGFGGSGYGVRYLWSAADAFSIPFTIEPGKASYIGCFERAPSLGHPKREAIAGAAGIFIVSDRHERDLEIARKKDPKLPPVSISVTDVSALGGVFFPAEPD
jgi:hypothetical protein